jgi:hypothetical protein ELI_1759
MKILDDLNTLISYPSRSEDGECCKEALGCVLGLAKSFGLETKCGRHGDVGIVELGEGEKTVGILVHVDVVSEGNLSLWKHDPFKLTEEDGMLYGRGIIDDKGPVIACLYALKEIKEQNIPLKKRIRMIIGTSEEIEWTDMVHYKEEFSIPDYGFTPDGNFPIYNRENGFMDIELRFREQFTGDAHSFKGGTVTNSVPSYAEYKLGEKTVSFNGKGAHSSAPELGVNAINLLCKDAEKYGFRFAKLINKFFPDGKFASNFTFVRRDGEPNKKEDLTIVPTVLKQEGDVITVNLNARQAYEIPGDNIVAALREKQEEYGYEVFPQEVNEAVYVDENQPWLKRMQKVTAAYGMSTECLLASGSSYAKCMPDVVSWGPVFPGEPDCAHMENERQSVESFLKTVEIYRDYLIEEGRSSD